MNRMIKWMIVPVMAVVGWTVAETVALNGNSERKMESTSVQLADGLIAPWGWKNVKEAVDGIAVRQDLTINYSALNSVQMDGLSTRNVVLESQRPLHWKVLLNEVLRGLEFGFIQNEAGVVEIMPFEKYHAYKTEEAQRNLQDNHKMVEATFQRMALIDALTDVTRQAGVSLNTGYLPLEICDPDAAAKTAESAAAKTDAKDKTAVAPPPVVKVYETSFKTITPMEWRNVFKNILDPHGYDFVEMDGAVCPMDKSRAVAMQASLLAAKPLIRQIVPVFYADPTDLMARIKELGVLSPRGQLSLTQSAGKNTIIGKVKSSSGGGANLALRPRVREDLVVSDVEENVVLVAEWIRKLDVSDGQVMIETRIFAIIDTGTKQMGVDWSGYENPLTLKMAGTTTKWNPSSPTTWGTLAGGSSAILTSPELTATLRMLNTMENVEKLSHPLVVLGNRTEGMINSTTKLKPYYLKRSSISSVGSTEIAYSVEEPDEKPEIGLTLWVSPEISPDKQHVRLSVKQTMEDLVKYVDIEDPSNPGELLGKLVETTDRTLDTRAVVRDGDTLVIGGLVKTDNTVKDTKVPFLGSIPLLGRLFRSEDKVVVKENVVVMITPTILNEDTPATGYEQKSEAKANELSDKGTDYFYNKPEKAEGGGQGAGARGQESGESNEKSATDTGGQPEVNGVKPKTEVKLSEEAKLSPAEREPDVKEIFQTLEAGGSGGGQKTEVSDQKAN